MNEDTKYNLLMWGVTLLAVLVFSSLGVIALYEKEIFISWRAHSGLSQGLGAEIIGWIFLGAAVATLSYQLKSSKLWFYSVVVNILYFISLVSYVLYKTLL